MKLQNKEKFIIAQALCDHIENIQDEIEDTLKFYDGSIEGAKDYIKNLEIYLEDTNKLFMKFKSEVFKDE